jgi:hypothetical protein
MFEPALGINVAAGETTVKLPVTKADRLVTEVGAI